MSFIEKLLSKTPKDGQSNLVRQTISTPAPDLQQELEAPFQVTLGPRSSLISGTGTLYGQFTPVEIEDASPTEDQCILSGFDRKEAALLSEWSGAEDRARAYIYDAMKYRWPATPEEIRDHVLGTRLRKLVLEAIEEMTTYQAKLNERGIDLLTMHGLAMLPISVREDRDTRGLVLSARRDYGDIPYVVARASSMPSEQRDHPEFIKVLLSGNVVASDAQDVRIPVTWAPDGWWDGKGPFRLGVTLPQLFLPPLSDINPNILIDSIDGTRYKPDTDPNQVCSDLVISPLDRSKLFLDYNHQLWVSDLDAGND
jgi:hypothetical protein